MRTAGDVGVDGFGRAIVAGVALVVAGLVRYRKTRRLSWMRGRFLEARRGFVLDLITAFDSVVWVGAGGVFDLYGEDFGVGAGDSFRAADGGMPRRRRSREPLYLAPQWQWAPDKGQGGRGRARRNHLRRRRADGIMIGRTAETL